MCANIHIFLESKHLFTEKPTFFPFIYKIGNKDAGKIKKPGVSRHSVPKNKLLKN